MGLSDATLIVGWDTIWRALIIVEGACTFQATQAWPALSVPLALAIMITAQAS